MSRTSALAVGLLVALGVLWIARAWAPGEERRIRARLAELAELATVDGPEPYTARLARAVRIGGFFAEDVAIELGRALPAVRGRDTVVGLAARAPVPAAGARIEFVDIQVWLAPDEERANANLTVTGEGWDASGREMVDAQELEMQLRKVDGTWLIERVAAVQPLERPFE